MKFRFNGWAKYENWQLDDAAGRTIPGVHWQPDIVLEGGSIDVNGAGLLLTTEECLLSPAQARNPELSRERLETVFHDYLGIDRTLWLNNGIFGDDTHGHIDDLARFTDIESIVIVQEADPSDENHAPLAENLERVKSMPLRVRTLPMPNPLWFDGVRLPASYANFYIANETVLVPTFNDPHDRLALNTLTECFPDRDSSSASTVWNSSARPRDAPLHDTATTRVVITAPASARLVFSNRTLSAELCADQSDGICSSRPVRVEPDEQRGTATSWLS